MTIRKIESCPPRGYVDGPQTWDSVEQRVVLLFDHVPQNGHSDRRPGQCGQRLDCLRQDRPLPLVRIGRLEADHAAQGGGRVLGEPFAVGLRKLVEPGRNYRQGERSAGRLARSEHGHVELVPRGLTRRGAGRVAERSVPGDRIRVPAQVPLAVKQHRGDVTGEQLFDQVHRRRRFAAARPAEERGMMGELLGLKRDRGRRQAQRVAEAECTDACCEARGRHNRSRRIRVEAGWWNIDRRCENGRACDRGDRVQPQDLLE